MSWACDPVLTSTVLTSYSAAGPMFAHALQTFLAAQCALVGDHVWPEDATNEVIKDPNFDFIVVGAGSAGAVVANRLTEVHNWKVLLVEAGGNPTLASEIPQLFYNNMNSKEDWAYLAQQDKEASLSFKNGCAWPRGKLLGGSSSINAMFYVRGNKADYDEWAAEGNTGWSYDDILPYFKKSENFEGDINEETLQYHGRDGYMNVQQNPSTNYYENLIINGTQELGIKYNFDYNGVSQMGVTKSFATIKDGIRQSTARAFLSPIKNRKNLYVMKNALATKILFEKNSNRATGIIIQKNGENIIVNANKEIILSAGCINTPQLMLLSGLGPRKHLESLNIEVKADLPVGENLQDHLFMPIYYKLPGDHDMSSLPNIIANFVENIMHKTGGYSSLSPHRAMTFINTTDPNSSSPDIQHHYIVLFPNMSNLIDIYGNHGLNEEYRNKFHEKNKNNVMIKSYTVLLKPKSRGRILLKSNDPNDEPLIFANYFNNPEDMRTVIRGLKHHILKLGETKAFKEAGAELQWLELDACKNYNKESDEFLICMVKQATFSLYHPTSTAKMGPDDDMTAVVNSQLKVRKVTRLRVIDASIMPTVVRGNTNAPSIMIGEKGADMIKSEWLKVRTEL